MSKKFAELRKDFNNKIMRFEQVEKRFERLCTLSGEKL